MTKLTGFPEDQGLYSSEFEHDSCGVGFVAHIKGQPSHQIILDADRINRHMTHRGACGCEENTGDGAGILTALPDKFLRKVAKAELGIDLPAKGKYGAGIVFLPKDDAARAEFKATVNKIIAEQGQKLLGWRDVPQRPIEANVGPSAAEVEPEMEMLLVGSADGIDQQAFDRQLFMIKKRASHLIRESEHPHGLGFYICTLSSSIIVYKGMLTPGQVLNYYPDLQDEDYESHLAMVHSRFSTNTFPSWDRAQPLRCIAHNGEINTVKGNSNWTYARQGALETKLYGNDLEKLFPIVEKHNSDSGNFDNVMEFLYHSGRKLQEVAMMMIPEAWQNHHAMSDEKRAFYEYFSALQEPWDGPASVSFTDGKFIGACLDRNGLRPSRYYVTHDDKVIMASEVGVLDVDPKNVKFKGRLQPGKMFLVDFEQGRLIPDEELKHDVARRKPYGEWLKNQRVELKDLVNNWQAGKGAVERVRGEKLLKQMQAFGYTTETMQFMLLPLVNAKKDPIYSMGDDASLACLSDQPRLLYDYFKQLFAQVTNPPIDSIREEVIMSLECYIGPEGNLLETSEKQCHRLRVPHPILTDEEVAAMKALKGEHGWKTKTIDATWAKAEGTGGLLPALERICQETEKAIDEGYAFVVLSDRACGPDRVAISSLLACGAVHHHLVRKAMRTRIGLVLESAEAREVHHFCLLTGYGADAINPYLAFDAVRDAKDHGHLKDDYSEDKIVQTYREGVSKGMLKVMGKMGISTLQSYKGAQIFEALGLAPDVIAKCFYGTPSRIRGINFEILAEEHIRRHELGFPSREESKPLPVLPNMGLVHWRHGGEKHGWNPYTIAEIQQAARAGDKDAYKRFAHLVNDSNQRQGTLRGLMRFKKGNPIPLEEVEPAVKIVKRFCTGAMSYGSISAEAHETIAIAMNRLGGKSNTGEGGEDYGRFERMGNGDSKRSAIKQVASGRFGVTSWYLTNADELQIKIAQGAKPGEGGELPGHKVDKIIAATRHATPGVGLISPPPHHDIYSIEDLAQLIFDLKNSNPSARVSVKLVSEVGVGTIAAGVSKGHADKILVSGDGGGTGASPLTSIKHAGLPWELGIAEAHQTLVMNDLRSRVRLETDGQLKTGRDVVIGCMLGAEEFGFATAPLITIGCIMMRKCHLNTCPVGVATQDPELRTKFNGQAEHVINYLFMVAEDAREIMAQLGFRTIDEMVGRADMIEWNKDIDHWKAKHLDLSLVLTKATSPYPNAGQHCMQVQNHGLEETLDQKLLIPCCKEAIEKAQPLLLDVDIQNIDRAFGTSLSHEVSKIWGAEGMPEDTIRLRCRGSAGQSLGAWAVRGVTIEVIGDANDYVGKGLSGGKIIVYPPEESTFDAEKNIIIGNVALYGATVGEAYFRGIAAERFCVRNSGAKAVVEGVGDHGLEYMTGGRVVVLGPTGRNFAAGMSGGVAYVYAPDADELRMNTNFELVDFETVEDMDDVAELKELIEKHQMYTGSTVAQKILDNWDSCLPQFVKVMPRDYKRVMEELKAAAAGENAGEEAALVV
ncbi:glutamate synthase large subunit [Planctomicrobium piriforme]|uniref:Glutamate synthase [NADPH] large chain n=1 Tax=Planctomicrobium piriforme TaxID=1576369 RepID=A0A1I3DFK2_9PLAN|nr:glutamate synthase large subunit [Planctomicrobium piriforme]SFH85495.1 glutamate synthase (NADPH/NADH) large chain [Planctomicrobium piriforme]